VQTVRHCRNNRMWLRLSIWMKSQQQN